MIIKEIELINSQSFPKEGVEHWLSRSTPRGKLENFTVNYVEFQDQLCLANYNGE